eukprot:504811-Hanusia_phi.AAC.4
MPIILPSRGNSILSPLPSPSLTSASAIPSDMPSSSGPSFSPRMNAVPASSRYASSDGPTSRTACPSALAATCITCRRPPRQSAASLPSAPYHIQQATLYAERPLQLQASQRSVAVGVSDADEVDGDSQHEVRDALFGAPLRRHLPHDVLDKLPQRHLLVSPRLCEERPDQAPHPVL